MHLSRIPRILAPVVLCPLLLAWALPPLHGEDKAPPLEATLRQLEKEIAKVRGLEFKQPVVARVIARPANVGPKAQGYYSPKEKALYVYDDLKGSYQRGVLIHEMVHALQDQHFKLDRVHGESSGTDADLARAAFIEGDATLTMIEVLKKEQPRAAAMLEMPFHAAKNLDSAFLYAQGARYVQALKTRGGWSAVNARYHFPPSATATILHPDERISTVDLGPGKTVGELGLLRQLRQHLPADDAQRAASGWRGDTLVDVEGSTSWLLAFASPAQAERCYHALLAAYAAEHDSLKVLRDRPTGRLWQRGEKGRLSVRLLGRRVLAVDAGSEKAHDDLVERCLGPLPLVVRTRAGEEISFGQLLDRLLEADLVCIGESHDSDLHHRVQLQIIRALHALDPRLGVGMEMFQSPHQNVLDWYLAGEISERLLLEQSEYEKRWGYDWSLYQPIVDFCRRNAIPLAALNAPRELTRRISEVGVEKLTDAEKKQLGPVDFHVKDHRDYWYERLAKMHGEKDVPAERKERSYQVMTTWDGFMAASAARFFKERGLRRLVIVAGSGHIERGFGIPDRAARDVGGRAVTIGVAVGKAPEEKEPTTDYLIIVAPTKGK